MEGGGDVSKEIYVRCNEVVCIEECIGLDLSECVMGEGGVEGNLWKMR